MCFRDGCLTDLEAADPDLVVGNGEADYVVDEGFGLAGALWHAEDVGEELFDEEQVRGGGECGVEGEDGAGAAETVAGEVEFGGCVYCCGMLGIWRGEGGERKDAGDFEIGFGGGPTYDFANDI